VYSWQWQAAQLHIQNAILCFHCKKSLGEGTTILRYTCIACHFCLRIHAVVSSERHSEYQKILPIYHGNYSSLNTRNNSRPRIFCAENRTGLYFLNVGQVDVQKEGSQNIPLSQWHYISGLSYYCWFIWKVANLFKNSGDPEVGVQLDYRFHFCLCVYWGELPSSSLCHMQENPTLAANSLQLCSEISAHCVKIMTTQVSHIFHKLHPFLSFSPSYTHVRGLSFSVSSSPGFCSSQVLIMVTPTRT